MKKLIYAALILLTISVSAFSFEEFKGSQLKFANVKSAYSQKESVLKKLVKSKNIAFEKLNIFIRAFKKEGELEVWCRSGNCGKFTHLKTYSICQSSGTLGPKRANGDRQTPEGFYHIDRFNPNSNFYLSLGINYPNASDKILGNKNPGGDIFIHGNCVTIGCIPLTDEYIREVYLLAVEAKQNGQTKIPVHIFPYKFNECKEEVRANDKTRLFWNNLKEGYNYFEKNHQPLPVTVLPSGKYSYCKR